MRLLKEFTNLLKRVPPTLMISKSSDEQVPQEPVEFVIGGQQIGYTNTFMPGCLTSRQPILSTHGQSIKSDIPTFKQSSSPWL